MNMLTGKLRSWLLGQSTRKLYRYGQLLKPYYRRNRLGSGESALTVLLFLASSIAVYALIQVASRPEPTRPKHKLTIHASTSTANGSAQNESCYSVRPEAEQVELSQNSVVAGEIEQIGSQANQIVHDAMPPSDLETLHFHGVDIKQDSHSARATDQAEVLYVSLASPPHADAIASVANLPLTIRTSNAPVSNQVQNLAASMDVNSQLTIEVIPRLLFAAPEAGKKFDAIIICLHDDELAAFESANPGQSSSSIIDSLQECSSAQLKQSGRLNVHIESAALRNSVIDHFERAGWYYKPGAPIPGSFATGESGSSSGSEWVVLCRTP